MRFPILVSPLWRPFLLPFGGSRDRSYVEIEDGTVRVRFGWLFDHRFPLDEVEGASPSHWPVWAGIGWRTNLAGTVGLVGTYVNVVEVRFKKPQRVRMLIPTRCQRLYVSLEEPREFMSALRPEPLGENSRAPAKAAAKPKAAPRRRKGPDGRPSGRA
jgi:hypothetical protein